jgi:hypothetical protein
LCRAACILLECVYTNLLSHLVEVVIMLPDPVMFRLPLEHSRVLRHVSHRRSLHGFKSSMIPSSDFSYVVLRRILEQGYIKKSIRLFIEPAHRCIRCIYSGNQGAILSLLIKLSIPYAFWPCQGTLHRRRGLGLVQHARGPSWQEQKKYSETEMEKGHKR